MVVGYSLLQIGRRVSLYPIETIVTFFVLTTLAYFHVLSAIKHSHFLSPTYSPSNNPVLAVYSDSTQWSLTQSTRSSPAVEIVQVQLSIPGDYPTLQSQITNELLNSSNQKEYSSVCYTHNNSCLTSIRPEAYTFTFDPSKSSSAASFARTLSTAQLQPEKDGISFDLVRQYQSIADIQSGKWLAYAGRALVLRFWSLAKVRSLCILSATHSTILIL
jgi:hydroxymethylglutaryl-CoA reductase (NADPH)